MSDFSWLYQQTQDALRVLPCVEVRQVPAAYAQQSAGNIQLQAVFYRLGDWGEMRAVLIQSPKIDIINIFFFPQAQWDVPVYAMEFVVLGGKRTPIVAVIDAVALCSEGRSHAQARTLLQRAHHTFPQLHTADDMPAWYLACRSGEDFFIRPQDEAELHTLTQAHRHLWQAFIALLPAAHRVSKAQAAAHAQALADYKQHHCDNTPGLKLLQQQFGATWTQHFLQDYLFGA